ncbi:MAG: EamA family transporter [Acidobacteria bacterium]|nr:EamA family transporter [Acidobacteriota bacterium]
MYSAYIFMLLGLLSFAAMGVFHKLADIFHCHPLHLTLFTMAFAALFAVINAFLFNPDASIGVPSEVILIAVPFGIFAAAAFWFFQRGLRFGKIATSWLVINLSSAVPTVLSILVYREPVNGRKVMVLLLVLISLLLLWWDRYRDQNKGAEPGGIAVSPTIGEGD